MWGAEDLVASLGGTSSRRRRRCLPGRWRCTPVPRCCSPRARTGRPRSTPCTWTWGMRPGWRRRRGTRRRPASPPRPASIPARWRRCAPRSPRTPRKWPPHGHCSRQLELALPVADGPKTVAASALAKARARLGADPWNGGSCAQPRLGRCQRRPASLAGPRAVCGRRDDAAGRRQRREPQTHFGGHELRPPEGGRAERTSGYPTAAAGRRDGAAVACARGGRRSGRTASTSVRTRSPLGHGPGPLPRAVDRNYLQANVLVPLMTTRHGASLVHAGEVERRSTRSIHRLGPGDELVEFEVSSEARRKDPVPAHALRCPGDPVSAERLSSRRSLLTSLVDATAIPPTSSGRSTTSAGRSSSGSASSRPTCSSGSRRSAARAPAAVAQEIWGLSCLQPGPPRDGADRTGARSSIQPDQLRRGPTLLRRAMALGHRPRPRGDPQRLRRRDRLAFLLPPRRPTASSPAP